MKVYDEMADYYDWIYSDELDLKFYLNEARNARGPVLEVACGTGRILLRLIQDGIDATGIDVSEGMLKKLQDKAKTLGIKANAIQADMTDFKINRKFNLIIMPYRSFLHLKDSETRGKTLQNLKEHLAKAGRLILHTYNPSNEERSMQDGYHNYDHEEISSPQGMKYRLDWFLHFEPRRRIGHYKIILKPEDGLEKEFLMDLSFVTNRELESLLKSAGFRNIKSYCGFSYGAINNECKEVLWIAER
ncbi:MAG: class I SAM-dependent methyltransferase [Candidatus Micrarchaeota archaeon]